MRNFAANLKSELSHMNLTDLEIRPTPCSMMSGRSILAPMVLQTSTWRGAEKDDEGASWNRRGGGSLLPAVIDDSRH